VSARRDGHHPVNLPGGRAEWDSGRRRPWPVSAGVVDHVPDDLGTGDDVGLPVGEPELFHDAPGGVVVWDRRADDPPQPALLEAKPERRTPTFGGQPASSPSLVEFPADLGLLRPRPVGQMVESDLANPGTGCPVDGGEGPQPEVTPLPQVVPGHLGKPFPPGGLPAEDEARDFRVANSSA
jgi:hypothetical protein